MVDGSSTRMDPANLTDSTQWGETPRMDLLTESCAAASMQRNRQPAETGDHESPGQARGRPGVAYESGEGPSTVYEGRLPQKSDRNDAEGAFAAELESTVVLQPTRCGGEHLAPSGLWIRPHRREPPRWSDRGRALAGESPISKRKTPGKGTTQGKTREVASEESPHLMPLKPERGGRGRLSQREVVKFSQWEVFNFCRRWATSPTASNALARPLDGHRECSRTRGAK